MLIPCPRGPGASGDGSVTDHRPDVKPCKNKNKTAQGVPSWFIMASLLQPTPTCHQPLPMHRSPRLLGVHQGPIAHIMVSTSASVAAGLQPPVPRSPSPAMACPHPCRHPQRHLGCHLPVSHCGYGSPAATCTQPRAPPLTPLQYLTPCRRPLWGARHQFYRPALCTCFRVRRLAAWCTLAFALTLPLALAANRSPADPPPLGE